MGSFQSSLSQSVHSIVVVLSCHAIHQWGGNSVRKWECFAQNTAAIKSQATLVDGLDIEFWFGMQRLLKLRIKYRGPILCVTSPALGSNDLSLYQSGTSIQILPELNAVRLHIFFIRLRLYLVFILACASADIAITMQCGVQLDLTLVFFGNILYWDLFFFILNQLSFTTWAEHHGLLWELWRNQQPVRERFAL